MTDKTQSAQADSLIDDSTVLGAYQSHYTSNRLRLLIQAGGVYTLAVVILQLLFTDVEDSTAAIFLPVTFALLALLAFWYVSHFWNRAVVLYEHGFTYREGSRDGVFRYEDIIAIRQRAERLRLFGVIPYDRYQCTLRTRYDETLVLNNVYAETGKLIDRLEKRIVRARLPLIRQRIQDDEPVVFGDAISLSRNGIEHQDRDLFWHEYAGYRLESGTLILQSQSDPEWLRVPLSDLDNLLLFIALLRTFGESPEATP